MPAVSDTSPISNLASIGHLHLLKSQFAEVCISDAVMKELMAHPDLAARETIQQALRDQWIRIGTMRDSSVLRVLLSQLHRGEAESIVLAIDLNADVVLMDEQEGRRLAAKAGLVVTGVLGILLRAKRMGEIAALKPAIHLLRTKAGFFIAPSLEAKVVAAAGE
jgi:predicted nucleic acid-binding protein